MNTTNQQLCFERICEAPDGITTEAEMRKQKWRARDREIPCIHHKAVVGLLVNSILVQ
ncbi:unnamed protein product [Prunus brigantina]